MSGNQKQQQSKQTQAKSIAKKAPEQVTQSINFEQLAEAPETMRADQILAAQKQVGNQVVQRALDSSKNRNAVTDKNGYLNDEISGTIQQKRGSGSPLPDSLRQDVSKRLKHDFDDVRIHTDEQAHALSRKINARAFTIGKDIFFKKGVFSPGSSQGRETIMHELTHVVQQSGASGASGRLKLGAPDTSHEKQADQVGKANSSVGPVSSASNSAVQRIPNVGGSLVPIEEEEPAVGGRETEDKAPSVGGMAPIPEEDTEIRQAKANRPQGILNTEIRGFDKSRLKSVPSAEQEAPDVGGRETEEKAPSVGGMAPIPEEAPDVGGSKDDDEVQMQPDMGVVQREEMPEEEMMMQPDPTVQRIEDEEMLQGQPDTGGLVQCESMPEEEELQMQPDPTVQRMEEDELQGQPDAGGLVQREQTREERDDIRKHTKQLFPVSGMKQKHGLMDEIKGFDKRKLQDSQARKEADEEEVKAKEEATANEAKAKEKTDAQEAKKTKYSKSNLLKTIGDTSSSSEDVEKSQKMMKTLHKRKGVFGGLKVNKSRGAKGERLKALKAESRAGKEGSFEKYEAEYGKASTYEKFLSKGTGGKAKMIGKGIGKGVLGAGKGMFNLGKRFLGKGVGDLSEQLFGKEEKKEEKKEAPAPVTVNVGGGGGGGGGGGFAMLEKYITENQQLKAKVAELEKEKG